MKRRTAPACDLDLSIPGCDAGPAGRLRFVWREAQALIRARRAARNTDRSNGAGQ